MCERKVCFWKHPVLWMEQKIHLARLKKDRALVRWRDPKTGEAQVEEVVVIVPKDRWVREAVEIDVTGVTSAAQAYLVGLRQLVWQRDGNDTVFGKGEIA